MTLPTGFKELTNAQRIKDGSFIDSVRRDLLPGLHNGLRDLFECEDDFYDASVETRLSRLRFENELIGMEGDSLPVKYGFDGFNAYAGIRLNGVLFFSEVQRPGVYLTADGGYLYDMPHGSLLDNYLHGELGKLLHDDARMLPEFSTLPIAYRVALVCKYVDRHVIALPDDITRFVLGCNESIKTHRFLIRPSEDQFGVCNGWDIRIRDVRPGHNFVKHISNRIKDAVAVSEGRESSVDNEIRQMRLAVIREIREEGGDFTAEEARAFVDSDLVSRFEVQPTQRNRAKRGDNNDSTATAKYEFVKRYIDENGPIPRGGWDIVAGRLAKETGISTYGRSLRTSIDSYINRHGLPKLNQQ